MMGRDHLEDLGIDS